MEMTPQLAERAWAYKEKSGLSWKRLPFHMKLPIDWQTVKAYCYRYRKGMVVSNPKKSGPKPAQRKKIDYAFLTQAWIR